MSTQAAADTIGSAPPVLVGGFVLFGYPLEQWVLMLTALYTTIMIVKNAPAALRGLCRGGALLCRKVQQLRQRSRSSTKNLQK